MPARFKKTARLLLCAVIALSYVRPIDAARSHRALLRRAAQLDFRSRNGMVLLTTASTFETALAHKGPPPQPQKGSSQQGPCPAGKYTDSSNRVSCILCTKGQYQMQPKSTSCSLCERGKYVDQEGNTVCISCPPGKHDNSTGADSCIGCVAGFWSRKQATTCRFCTTGQYSPSTTLPCKGCPADYVSADYQSSCIKCNLGFYTHGSTCSPCPVSDTNVVRALRNSKPERFLAPSGGYGCGPKRPGKPTSPPICTDDGKFKWAILDVFEQYDTTAKLTKTDDGNSVITQVQWRFLDSEGQVVPFSSTALNTCPSKLSMTCTEILTKTPTAFPTRSPTQYPTTTPTTAPTSSPTSNPTSNPTMAANHPTALPTPAPTAFPTAAPTKFPTPVPTASPTAAPTKSPTAAPTNSGPEVCFSTEGSKIQSGGCVFKMLEKGQTYSTHRHIYDSNLDTLKELWWDGYVHPEALPSNSKYWNNKYFIQVRFKNANMWSAWSHPDDGSSCAFKAVPNLQHADTIIEQHVHNVLTQARIQELCLVHSPLAAGSDSCISQLNHTFHQIEETWAAALAQKTKTNEMLMTAVKSSSGSQFMNVKECVESGVCIAPYSDTVYVYYEVLQRMARNIRGGASIVGADPSLVWQGSFQQYEASIVSLALKLYSEQAQLAVASQRALKDSRMIARVKALTEKNLNQSEHIHNNAVQQLTLFQKQLVQYGQYTRYYESDIATRGETLHNEMKTFMQELESGIERVQQNLKNELWHLEHPPKAPWWEITIEVVAIAGIAVFMPYAWPLENAFIGSIANSGGIPTMQGFIKGLENPLEPPVIFAIGEANPLAAKILNYASQIAILAIPVVGEIAAPIEVAELGADGAEVAATASEESAEAAEGVSSTGPKVLAGLQKLGGFDTEWAADLGKGLVKFVAKGLAKLGVDEAGESAGRVSAERIVGVMAQGVVDGSVAYGKQELFNCPLST